MWGNKIVLNFFYIVCGTTLISISVDSTVLLNSKSTDFKRTNPQILKI